MRRAILTIGPQYVGKSTFCGRVLTARTDVTYVSRDDILNRLYGTVWLDSYSGGHHAALEEMWQEVAAHLNSASAADKTLILDAWNGPRNERAAMVGKLRQLGADCVDGWHFVTPLKMCIAWSFEKNPIEIKNKWSELRRDMRIESYSNIHRTFCGWDIAKEGVFDTVRRLNALDPIPEDLFNVTT